MLTIVVVLYIVTGPHDMQNLKRSISYAYIFQKHNTKAIFSMQKSANKVVLVESFLYWAVCRRQYGVGPRVSEGQESDTNNSLLSSYDSQRVQFCGVRDYTHHTPHPFQTSDLDAFVCREKRLTKSVSRPYKDVHPNTYLYHRGLLVHIMHGSLQQTVFVPCCVLFS
jgi:hypothetical protein